MDQAVIARQLSAEIDTDPEYSKQKLTADSLRSIQGSGLSGSIFKNFLVAGA